MNMNIIICVLFFALIYSCSSQSDNAIENDFFEKGNQMYDDGKARFKKKFISHFPDKIDKDKYLDFNESLSPEFDMVRLTLFNKASEKEIEKLKRKYKKSIGIYSSADSCLLVVNRFATMERNVNIKVNDSERKLIDRDCYEDKYPVPNFWHNQFTDLSTECNLSSDFTVYVIESESGIFLSKDKLSNGKYMPNEWNHGYSYGIAISEEQNVVIYWVVMW